MNRTIVLTAVLVAGGLFAAEPEKPAAEAPKSDPPKRELLKPCELPGLKNFAKVSDALYRGEQPTKEGFRELKKMGVKTVVNLRSFNSDRGELKGTGLQYVHIYCAAWNPEDEDVVAFLKVMADKGNHPVFVHCQHGADRTGMMVASYRMIEQGWSIDEATQEIHNFGFHKLWKDIQKYLKEFNAERMKRLVEAADAPKVDVVK